MNVHVAVSFVLVLFALAPAVASAEDKPLTGPELTELLGPSAPSALRWTRPDGPDSRVYRGQSADRGHTGVGFYLGFAPSFEPDAHSTTHPARLGAFDVVWHRWRQQDVLCQTTLITLPSDDGYKSFIHAWVYGPDEASLDALAQQLAVLPRFARSPAAK